VDDRTREAVAEHLEGRRQLKTAWDTFHHGGYRQTFIHCRLALDHLMGAVVILAGGETVDDILHPFLAVLGGGIPLDQAGSFDDILHPPELRPIAPVTGRNLSDSVQDWFFTRTISRGRAFEHLTRTQETVNLVLRLVEERFPDFLGLIRR
jgi:hypothetical protein